MIIKTRGEFEDGYGVGWVEGRDTGYAEGYYAAVQDYEPRISRYWAELQTLNARISHLEKQLKGNENE